MITTILWILLIAEIVVIFLWWIGKKIGTPKDYAVQKEVDMRLTYKRYVQLYPSTRITYQEYKRMQMQGAYRRAVSSMKIRRMVR